MIHLKHTLVVSQAKAWLPHQVRLLEWMHAMRRGCSGAGQGLPWLLKQAEQLLTWMCRPSQEFISVCDSVLPFNLGEQVVLDCRHTHAPQ